MIESLHNEQVKFVVSLQRRKAREENKAFVVEGWRFVDEAVRRDALIQKVYVCLDRDPREWQALRDSLFERKIPFEEVDERVLRKMSSTEEPQGILAVVSQKNYSWSDVLVNEQTVLLILDGLQDPGNLGTILRTALASGVRYVCLTQGTVDLYNPKVLRSTMGAVFSLVILQSKQSEEILGFCQEQGLSVLMGDIQGNPIYSALLPRGPLALVVGNEGKGPSPVFRNTDGQHITISMAHDVESLNVAMATGILLYELFRRRAFL